MDVNHLPLLVVNWVWLTMVKAIDFSSLMANGILFIAFVGINAFVVFQRVSSSMAESGLINPITPVCSFLHFPDQRHIPYCQNTSYNAMHSHP
jgi:hypothetical protein